jgi:hypothetical protein
MSTTGGPGGSLFVLPDRAVFQKELSDRYQVTEAVTFEDPETTSVPSQPQNNGTSGPILNSEIQAPPAEPVGEYAALYPEATIPSDVPTNRRGHGRRAADDEDFNPRRRNRPGAAGGKPTKKGKRLIHDESDSPVDDDGPAILPIQQTSKSGSFTRRSSRRITSTNQPQTSTQQPSNSLQPQEDSPPAREIVHHNRCAAPAPPDVTKGRVVEPRKAVNLPQRRAMTEAEKNRKAKFLAVRGEVGMEEWSGSE